MHWKKSLLVIQKILKLFPSTLTVDDNHYLLNRDNLTQSIQMQLYQKQKKFSEFFVTFLKSILNFKHMAKKDTPHSWCISPNTGCEKHGSKNLQQAVFQRTLRQRTWKIGRNNVPIWMIPPLQNSSITVKVVALEKVAFSDTQNPKTVC